MGYDAILDPKQLTKDANCTTTKVKPGIKRKAYMSRICDFLVLQVPDFSDVDIENMGFIDLAHTFEVTDGFIQMDLLFDENELNFKFTGEAGVGLFDLNAVLMTEGMSKTARGMLNQYARQELVFLIPIEDNKILQIGSLDFPAYVSPEFGTNKQSSTDKVGVKWGVKCMSDFVYEYDSTLAITLRP